MQDCGRLDGGEEKCAKALCMALQARTQLPKTEEDKERMEIGMRRVFESAQAANRDSDSYKQPLLASSRVIIGSMRHLRWRFHPLTQTANPRHGTLGPDGYTRTECIWPLSEAPLANQCCVC